MKKIRKDYKKGVDAGRPSGASVTYRAGLAVYIQIGAS